MQERWQNSNGNIPEIDQEDINSENPMFNNGLKPSPDRQHHPEFTQTSYLRLRSMEEAYLMTNYFEPYRAAKGNCLNMQAN